MGRGAPGAEDAHRQPVAERLSRREDPSRLPWFEEALERRIDYLMSEGNSFEEARDTSILRLTSLDDKTEGGYASV